MELSWLQSLIMGLFSGLTDILPVSSQAHQTLLMKLFGVSQLHPVMRLAIHLATVLTLLVVCWGQIGRIRRQVRLSRLPKRRRQRLVDLAALMDAKILRTAFWPILLGLLFYTPASRLGGNLLWLVIFSLVNAVILYLPNLLQTANKDSRLVTPVEGFLMGLGAGAAVLPGISSVGACYSAGVIHGVDRGYMIHLTMLMHIMVVLGHVVYDILAIVALGTVSLDAGALVCCLVAGVCAAVGTAIGYRVFRAISSETDLTVFSLYSFGVALFTFILYLMV